MTDAARAWLDDLKVREDAYGFDVVYVTHSGEQLECHYVGTEAKARYRTSLRSGMHKIVSTRPLTEKAYVAAYGRGRS